MSAESVTELDVKKYNYINFSIQCIHLTVHKIISA